MNSPALTFFLTDPLLLSIAMKRAVQSLSSYQLTKRLLNLNDNPNFHHDEHLPEKKGSTESTAYCFFPTGLLKLVVNNYFLP